MHIPDLLNCENEQIRIPGKVQNHGFLIAINTSGKIKFCSENISQFISITAESILNKTIDIIDNFFRENDQAVSFVQLLQEWENTEHGEFRNPYLLKTSNQSFSLAISKSGDYRLLEFEPEDSDTVEALHSLVGKAVSAILATSQFSEFLSTSSEQIRKIIIMRFIGLRIS